MESRPRTAFADVTACRRVVMLAAVAMLATTGGVAQPASSATDLGTVVVAVEPTPVAPPSDAPAGGSLLDRMDSLSFGGTAPLDTPGEPIGDPLQDRGEGPLLVPLPPPLWAGLAVLGGLVVTRIRQRRSSRVPV